MGSGRPKFILRLVESFGQPQLDYIVRAWGLCLVIDVKMVKQVRRIFIRCHGELVHMEIGRRLKEMNLYSLERLRGKAGLIRAFRFAKGLTKLHGHRGSLFRMRGI